MEPMTDNELKALYPEIFIKFDTIFYDSKKYNLIDRFFHFSIESTDFTKRVNSMILKNNYEYTKNILHCYGFDITNEIELTIKKIKECYGLWNPKFHLESNRKLFLNDPNLLGISPFLFDQESWKKVMLNEIEKFKHEENHLNPVFWIIRDCLNETFERLGIKEFSEFQGIFHFFNGWDENIKTSTDIFALIADEYIDYSEILEFTKADEKREKQFLKSEMNVKSIQSKIKINLPFEKADKVFEKYFEMNFTNDRFDEIYQKFKVFLRILYNKVSKETEIKSVDLTEEEVKKMIGFFSYFKTDTEYPNTIFTYKVDDLIGFLERISGLDAKKEAWRQSHKPSNIAVETVKDLVKEINSIIPEKSAVKKRFEHKT